MPQKYGMCPKKMTLGPMNIFLFVLLLLANLIEKSSLEGKWVDIAGHSVGLGLHDRAVRPTSYHNGLV